jgi:hypothetical protein
MPLYVLLQVLVSGPRMFIVIAYASKVTARGSDDPFHMGEHQNNLGLYGNLLLMQPAIEAPEDVRASSHDTVAALVGQVRDSTPLRIAFAQRLVKNEKLPGPLASFVTSGDHRGLLLYLLALTRGTRQDPWDVALPSAVWARALDVPLPTTKSASSAISKAWLRIERRGLIKRSRAGRTAKVTLLREDGSGADYTHPANEGGYFKVPHALWLEGPQHDKLHWYEVLDLPAIAMLLVACSHQSGFSLPVERAPDWYGFSADTAHRGFGTLTQLGAIDVTKSYKKAPLSPLGYTFENRYTLVAPFAHRHGSSIRRGRSGAK